MFTWLNELSVHSNPNSHGCNHDLKKPCLICENIGHTFKGCPVLNDHEFLKIAYIKTCLYFSTVQRAQLSVHVRDLCVELNQTTPQEEEYDQIWENSCEDFESQDF